VAEDARPQNGDDEMEKVAAMLIEAGCDIDARNYAGETPLFALTGRLALGREDSDRKAQFLSLVLKYGANPCATDRNGNTPLPKVWGWKQNERVVELLVKAGADINTVNESGGSTLLFLRQKLSFSTSACSPNSPNRQYSDGNTALHRVRKSWLCWRHNLVALGRRVRTPI
jgi:ankyrin repeat protein